jgi:organic radical activating enzyme
VANQAYISEIFKSIQGEGKWVGYPQLFIRFCGCNLKCRYCDTPNRPEPSFKVYPSWGKEFYKVNNPIEPAHLIQLAGQIGFHEIHSLSITGGEPLLQEAFLREFLPGLKEKHPVKVFLETNGTLPEPMRSIAPWLDYVSMDFKLAAYLDNRQHGCAKPITAHRSFLAICTGARIPTYVKIVLDDDFERSEFNDYLEILVPYREQVDLYIQPVTSGGRTSLHPENIGLILAECLKKGIQARILPQVHKFLNLI